MNPEGIEVFGLMLFAVVVILVFSAILDGIDDWRENRKRKGR